MILHGLDSDNRTLSQKSKIGKKTLRGAFLLYKFIGDVVYPMIETMVFLTIQLRKKKLPRRKAH